ncbi:MAG TPA: hypothetical protein VHB21_13970, partial [Minicystis sp.]|nr:hypothetical protein [Minicystis sp.]
MAVRPRFRAAAAAALLALAAAFAAGAAAGDEPKTLSGTWNASSMSESWSVRSWGDACGPKPAPHGAPGGTVQVTQTGSELRMSGAGRGFTTGECWEQMPGLSRTGHTGGARGWRTTCATPANDARQAQIVTTISATDSTIVIQEVGQYQFVIHDTTCQASVTRVRSMTLAQ